ncbi:hypothetical protein [Derxia lacustris]|uniref:hypothetical protein n=1 Tax=Derxia lacustris TaxID=764842 RepID=UPI00111BDE9A|nr:hypothetical protein [Derxia lacustris]
MELTQELAAPAAAGAQVPRDAPRSTPPMQAILRNNFSKHRPIPITKDCNAQKNFDRTGPLPDLIDGFCGADRLLGTQG